MRGRRTCLLLALGLLHARRGVAQTADSLAAARQLYNDLSIERAVPLLRAVVSPSWPFPVSTAERAAAYELLGASFALLNAPDSAIAAFRKAIDADPFSDLDPQRFTPSQIRLFRDAQDSVLTVAIRPVDSVRIDPRVDHVVLQVLTTHTATLLVSLRTPGGESIPLFDGQNRGLRPVEWDALLPDGSFAPPGRYELVARGTSRIVSRSDSARIFFDLARDGPALDDTLPSLGAADLVPSRYGGAGVRHDVLHGLAVAAGAFAVATLLPNTQVDGGHGRALIVTGAVLAATGATVVARRRHPDLGAAVAENARRQAARAAQNDRIRRSNAEKLNRTRLVITPAAGSLP